MGILQSIMYSLGWLKRPSEERNTLPEPKPEKRKDQLPYYGRHYYVSRMKRAATKRNKKTEPFEPDFYSPPYTYQDDDHTTNPNDSDNVNPDYGGGSFGGGGASGSWGSYDSYDSGSSGDSGSYGDSDSGSDSSD